MSIKILFFSYLKKKKNNVSKFYVKDHRVDKNISNEQQSGKSELRWHIITTQVGKYADERESLQERHPHVYRT